VPERFTPRSTTVVPFPSTNWFPDTCTPVNPAARTVGLREFGENSINSSALISKSAQRLRARNEGVGGQSFRSTVIDVSLVIVFPDNGSGSDCVSLTTPYTLPPASRPAREVNIHAHKG